MKASAFCAGGREREEGEKETNALMNLISEQTRWLLFHGVAVLAWFYTTAWDGKHGYCQALRTSGRKERERKERRRKYKKKEEESINPTVNNCAQEGLG